MSFKQLDGNWEMKEGRQQGKKSRLNYIPHTSAASRAPGGMVAGGDISTYPMTNLGKGRAGQKVIFGRDSSTRGQRGRGTSAGPGCDTGVGWAPKTGHGGGMMNPQNMTLGAWTPPKRDIGVLEPPKNVTLKGGMKPS